MYLNLFLSNAGINYTCSVINMFATLYPALTLNDIYIYNTLLAILTNTNPLLMDVTDIDVSENLHVHVYTVTEPKPVNCGACSILWQLFYSLRDLGIFASAEFDDGSCGKEVMEKHIASNKN